MNKPNDSLRTRIAHWNNLVNKWKKNEHVKQGNTNVEILIHKEELFKLLGDIYAAISNCSMGQILKLSGFVQLLSNACALPAVVAVASQQITLLLTTILQAPSGEKPDPYELRGQVWAANILQTLLPTFVDKQGFTIAATVGVDGAKLHADYVASLSNSIADRLSSLPPDNSATYVSPFPSSSIGFPLTPPSPHLIRELSRLCLMVMDNPYILSLIEKIICLQPGASEEFQLDPFFVKKIMDSQIFDKISLSAKYALWVHSTEVFSIMVSSLLEIPTNRIFLSDEALESSVEASALCHVIARHPTLYSEFLRRIEADWLKSRSFATLRLARAANACLVRAREREPRSLALSGYFEPQFGAFVSVLGRVGRFGTTHYMVEDAQRMNELRKRMLSETPELCSQLWLVLFFFVDWTCAAIISLLFSANQTHLAPLAEYISWLVSPSPPEDEETDKTEELNNMTQTPTFKATATFQAIHLPPAIVEKETDDKREKRVDMEVLEVICSLPLPRELALQVIAKYITNRSISESQIAFLLRFACFGKTSQGTEFPTTLQSQAFGLFLVEKISKTCKLPTTSDVILNWIEELEKATENSVHESDISSRIAEVRNLFKV